jgi:hypothetical protein
MTNNSRQNKRSIRKSKKISKGGTINEHNILKYIESVGFEIETTDLVKLTITDIDGDTILVNSSLTNIDLEYGLVDENEYTNIKALPDESFKITNDAAEDSDFNDYIKTLYDNPNKTIGGYSNDDGADDEGVDEDDEEDEEDEGEEEEDNDDCDDVVIRIEIPKNNILNKTSFDLKFREPSNDLKNCSTFTDTEFIATYYKPNKTNNIIKEYLFKSVIELRNHLKDLKTIPNSYMLVNKNDQFKKVDGLINQCYILPNTSLIYFNSSLYNKPNYNINNDLQIVIQCTFSCSVEHVYKIMTHLLTIDNKYTDVSKINSFITKNMDNSNVENLIKTVKDTQEYLNYDIYLITESLNTTKLLFNKYDKISTDKFTQSTEFSRVKMYLFLIIYKLYIYLNSFIQLGDMLKKHLSFAVRHNNYVLFSEMKKNMKKIFQDKSEDELHTIIDTLLDETILNKLYNTAYIKNQKRKAKFNNDGKDTYGDPLHSIKSYFEYFYTNDDDWLVVNQIDEKSTKFDLDNDKTIIEFRDFPFYSYLELFYTSNDEIRNEIIKNNIGTLTMKIFNDYINSGFAKKLNLSGGKKRRTLKRKLR